MLSPSDVFLTKLVETDAAVTFELAQIYFPFLKARGFDIDSTVGEQRKTMVLIVLDFEVGIRLSLLA